MIMSKPGHMCEVERIEEEAEGLAVETSRIIDCVCPSTNGPLNATKKKGEFLQMNSLLTWKMIRRPQRRL
jgi:hypothetical protein